MQEVAVNIGTELEKGGKKLCGGGGVSAISEVRVTPTRGRPTGSRREHSSDHELTEGRRCGGKKGRNALHFAVQPSPKEET